MTFSSDTSEEQYRNFGRGRGTVDCCYPVKCISGHYGELIFGLKIENPRADANVETSVRVPGIAFAEWGPGDHGFYIMGRPGTYKGGGETAPEMAAVRRRVLNATKAAGVKFLNACNEKNVIEQIKDGTMICTGGDSPAADIGRKFTNRTDPF